MAEAPKGRRKGCCCCLVLPIVLLSLAVVGSRTYHNWNLLRISRSFATLQHPPGTKRVRTLEYVGGNITGTGNQMDYFVADVRSFTGSKQAVRDFYFRQNMISPLNGTSRKPTVVMIDDDSIDAQVFFWAQGINEWNLLREEDTTRYVVYFYGGDSSGLDLRGY